MGFFNRNCILAKPLYSKTMKHLKIADFWRENYSSKNKIYEEFTVTDYFRKMAAIFAPGESYFYILNMHNLELDYISPEVSIFYKNKSGDMTMEKLLEAANPNHIPILQKKESVIKDFFINFLDVERITDYKILYSYDLIDHYGKSRTMLLQATPLSISDEGFVKHVLSIHTDISHITPKASNNVSFMDITGEKSYFNVDTQHGRFKTQYVLGSENSPQYTKREKQIIKLLSQGFESGEIAEILNISSNTVTTHRRNILRKGEFKNTAHLIGDFFKIGIN